MQDYSYKINQIHGNISIEDDDEIIIINPETKKLEIPKNFSKEISVVGDHKSNAITFRCPKIIENHSVIDCEFCYLKWQNGKHVGTYNFDRTAFDSFQGDTFNLVWEIDGHVTQQPGQVSFQICFKDTKQKENDPTKTELIYQWSTIICKDFSIGNSIVLDDTELPPSEGTSILYINGKELSEALNNIYK